MAWNDFATVAIQLLFYFFLFCYIVGISETRLKRNVSFKEDSRNTEVSFEEYSRNTEVSFKEDSRNTEEEGGEKSEIISLIAIGTNIKGQSVCIVPEGVTKLEGFSDQKIEMLSIPTSVEIIEDHAFYWNHIKSLTIPPSVITIGKGAFSWNKIYSLAISSSVTTIGEKAFFSNNLTSITVPASVLTIGKNAFSGNFLTFACYEGEERPLVDKDPSYYGINVPFERCKPVSSKDMPVIGSESSASNRHYNGEQLNAYESNAGDTMPFFSNFLSTYIGGRNSSDAITVSISQDSYVCVMCGS